MNQLSTERQQAILQLLHQGYGIRAIARLLGVNKNTVTSLRDKTVEKAQSHEKTNHQRSVPL